MIAVECNQGRIIAEIERLVQVIDNVQFKNHQLRFVPTYLQRGFCRERVIGEINGLKLCERGEIQCLQLIVRQVENSYFRAFVDIQLVNRGTFEVHIVDFRGISIDFNNTLFVYNA